MLRTSLIIATMLMMIQTTLACEIKLACDDLIHVQEEVGALIKTTKYLLVSEHFENDSVMKSWKNHGELFSLTQNTIQSHNEIIDEIMSCNGSNEEIKILQLKNTAKIRSNYSIKSYLELSVLPMLDNLQFGLKVHGAVKCH